VSRRKRLLLRLALVAACITAAVLAMPASYIVRGWWNRESFYHGLPSGYWSGAVARWAARYDQDDDRFHVWRRWAEEKFHLNTKPSVLEGGPTATPVLVDLLIDDNPRVPAQALKGLAHAWGWESRLPESHFLVSWSDVSVISPGGTFLAWFGSDSGEIPGRMGKHFYLLNRDGRLLDAVTLEASNRLLMFDGIRFWTEILDEPTSDGARLVVRYKDSDGSVKPYISYEMTHGAQTYEYGPDSRFPRPQQLPDWDTQGLCRIAVLDDRLEVVYPKHEHGTRVR
jgi:hypothetical protein